MLTVEEKKAYMVGYTTATAQQFGGDNNLSVTQVNYMALDILRELFDEFGYAAPSCDSIEDYFKFFLEVDEIGKVLLRETRLR
jgi:hypothetical protein